VHASHGRIPSTLLFDHALSAAAQNLRSGARRLLSLGDRHTTEDFEAWSYRNDGDAFSFNAIQRLVEQLPRDIYRGKGIERLALAGGDHGVFQMAGRRSTLKLTKPPAGSTVTTELVFIGRPGATTDAALADLVDLARQQAENRAPHLVSDLRAFQVEFL
jgi:G3E family GTPase